MHMRLINKNRIIVSILVCVIIVVISVTVDYQLPFTSLVIEASNIHNDVEFQMFYDTGSGYNEKESVISPTGRYERAINEIRFKLPICKTLKGIRIDPGNGLGTISIKSISLQTIFISTYKWDAKGIIQDFVPNGAITGFTEHGSLAHVQVTQNDPYFIFNDMLRVYADVNKSYRLAKKILNACILIILLGIILISIKLIYRFNLHLYIASNVRGFVTFIRELYVKRKLIWDFTMNDLKTRFAGSHLGIVWAFVMPIITILIFWLVFENGFKTPPVTDYPFVLWLSAGIVPWYFFLDCVTTATNSILDYSFLVKKVVFRVSILPIVKIFAALLIHLFFILLLIVINALYGYYPTLYLLQLVYYLFAMIVLLLGISWITSAAIIFFRDMGPFVNTVLQFLFWGTPIFWSIKMIPDKYQILFKINPVFYLIQGYRDCFINKVWFWERWEITLGYWCVTIFIFLFGAIFFMKLKPHFADVI